MRFHTTHTSEISSVFCTVVAVTILMRPLMREAISSTQHMNGIHTSPSAVLASLQDQYKISTQSPHTLLRCLLQVSARKCT